MPPLSASSTAEKRKLFCILVITFHFNFDFLLFIKSAFYTVAALAFNAIAPLLGLLLGEGLAVICCVAWAEEIHTDPTISPLMLHNIG